jgi:phage-related protein
MSEKFVREILYYKNYYLDFFNKLNDNTKKKFNWTLKLIATLERIPDKYFKHLKRTDGLYEIRVESSGNIYRVFCFFDEGQLIILINGFQKKSQKTPSKEIKKAEKLKKQYYNEK